MLFLLSSYTQLYKSVARAHLFYHDCTRGITAKICKGSVKHKRTDRENKTLTENKWSVAACWPNKHKERHAGLISWRVLPNCYSNALLFIVRYKRWRRRQSNKVFYPFVPLFVCIVSKISHKPLNSFYKTFWK